MTTITEVNFDKTKTAGTSGQQLSSNNRINFSSHGVITSVKDGVATCSGLRGISFNEMVIIKDNIYGLCMNLETDTVGIIILGNDRLVGMGDSVRRAFKVVTINAEHAFLGRVVDPLSNPVDGYPLSYEPNFLPWDQKQLELELTSNEISEKDEDITNKDIVSYFFGDNATSRKKNFFYPIDTKAPGIVDRESISESLFTGIKIIDSMIPVGRGQRELIIGDRQTGKSAIAVDTVINQRISQNSNFWDLEGEDQKNAVFCIYVVVGQKRSTLAHLVHVLEKYNCLPYTTIVSATSSDSAPMQYLAPYMGCALGEVFRDNGRHALVVYDDLSKQAVAYRQISLLLRRSPGREAYPGDIFFLHSRLLERAAKINRSLAGGSLTALPIIETQEGDVSAYIPTNVISITDGQIFLDKSLFNRGIIPAINIGLSVSRVGSAAQVPAMKQVAGTLKLELAQFKEVDAFISFAADLDETTLHTLNRGLRLVELLKQKQFEPLPVEAQILIIFAGVNGFLDSLTTNLVTKFLDYVVREYYAEYIYEKDFDLDTLDTEFLSTTLREIKATFVKYIKRI